MGDPAREACKRAAAIGRGQCLGRRRRFVGIDDAKGVGAAVAVATAIHQTDDLDPGSPQVRTIGGKLYGHRDQLLHDTGNQAGQYHRAHQRSLVGVTASGAKAEEDRRHQDTRQTP